MNLPRPMKAMDASDRYFHHDPNTQGSFFAAEASSYVMEPKIDGVRAFLMVKGGWTQIVIASSGTVVSHELPRLMGLTNHFDQLMLDGELVVPGQPLGSIVGALNSTKRKSILDRAVFYTFDLLHVNESALDSRPLEERRAALEAIASLLPSGVQIVPQYEPSHEVADAIRTTGFEGFMLKRTDSVYLPTRKPTWLKVKWLQTIDCFVTDWQPGKGGYEGLVGALCMSVYDEHGQPVEIGKHGVFPEKLRQEMSAADGSLRPEWYGKVMELTYQDTGTNLRLRHPRLYRLRPDKCASDCELTQLTDRVAVIHAS